MSFIRCLITLLCCVASIAYADSAGYGEVRRKVEEAPVAVYESPGFFPVRVALQWLPQSQFAGFYMAQEKGFYRGAGLDVTLLHAGPGPSPLDFMQSGKADVATFFLADGLTLSNDSHRLVNFGQLVQRPNLMLVAWKESGITQPKDLDGKRVSIWESMFSVSFVAFFNQNKVSPILVSQPTSVNLFLSKGVDACAAMSYNELNRIYQAGVDLEELTIFPMHEYGLGFPEDGLYAFSDYAFANKKELLALQEQTMKGWEYARDHPEEALDIVLKLSHEAGQPANRAHARWMLEHILDVIFYSQIKHPYGVLGQDDFSHAVDALRGAGRLNRDVSYANFVLLPTVSGE